MYICTYVIHLRICLSFPGDDGADDGLTISAAVGITFVVTLLISVALTLIVVCAVYKIKQKSPTRNISTISTAITSSSLPRDSTIKETKYQDENYEYPENIDSAKETPRYQGNPGAAMQPNPAYSLEQFNGRVSPPVYENLK